MPDNEDDLVTFKIERRQRDWALDEQERIRKSSGGKVSQAALFERMRDVYQTAESSSIPKSDESGLPDSERESLPPPAGNDIRTTRVLQVVPEQTTPSWEQRAVDEILKTNYAEAFRVNIRAVYLLAMGRPVDVPGQFASDAGSESLSGGEVEEIHKGLGDLKRAVAAAEKGIQKSAGRRKRSRKPQKRIS